MMHAHVLPSLNSSMELWGVLPLKNGKYGRCSATQTDQNFPDRLFCFVSYWLNAFAEGLSSCCRLAVVVAVFQQGNSEAHDKERKLMLIILCTTLKGERSGLHKRGNNIGANISPGLISSEKNLHSLEAYTFCFRNSFWQQIYIYLSVQFIKPNDQMLSTVANHITYNKTSLWSDNYSQTCIKQSPTGNDVVTALPFNSHEWPRYNFSLQYQYNIKQTSDENKVKYQLGDYKLIQYQILLTDITRTVCQTVRRITKWDLGS